MRVGSFMSPLLFSQRAFFFWTWIKNMWEQVSAALECRETGEPLNTVAAPFALISLDEGCGPFIMLFLL